MNIVISDFLSTGYTVYINQYVRYFYEISEHVFLNLLKPLNEIGLNFGLI